MPTTPLSLALIQLWIADPALPWSNPVWQSLTHIPGDPWAYGHGKGASHVAEWTVDEAQAVEAFMNNCKTAEDPAEHYAVKGKDKDHEGRTAWNAWVQTSWAKWNINKLVDRILEESGCEPHVVMARLKCKITDVFPTMEAAQLKHVISVNLADALFGDDAFTDGTFIVPSINTFITALLVLSWSRHRKVIKRQVGSIQKKSQEVEEQWLAMTAANSTLTLVSIRAYLKKLESLITLISVFKDQEMAETFNARREQVNAMLAAAKKRPIKAEPIAFREMLLHHTSTYKRPHPSDEVSEPDRKKSRYEAGASSSVKYENF
ncbi:uncharacterized protein BJ212DRAFT_1298248 [Suillus subaureus]|uniref:Uncharacterized protein n=1 Tax=Suillus subaureus TaxID=48587 RepID=A0A9P7EF92_9AGAM|nr:uncharacterized protein BJ212DRAFT_1298248 [Suillus subaureus]KAG1819852.1 hypothetical protein BJ212DRAFT_1298248 [Suillus subaureus]